MIQPRETVLNALFALLVNASQFKTKGRKFIHWSQVDPDARPAMFLVEKTEDETVQDFAAPTIGVIEVTVIIYVNTQDAEIPAAILNPIIDALDNAIRPTAMQTRQTLGGLVENVWKEGKTIKIPGDIDGDGMAFIPLKILVP